jgi:hypothetical protein
MPEESIVDQIPGRMPELLRYFEESRETFGRPKIDTLDRAFDLTWESEPKISLRWSWREITNISLYPKDEGLILCALTGNYEFHLKLQEDSNPCVYASPRLKRFPGSVPGSYPYANRIVECLTCEGEYLNRALEAGLNLLNETG